MVYPAGGAWALGAGGGFNEPQPQVLQDGLDDFPVFDDADEPHDSPTLRTGQGIDLVDFLDQPGPVLAVFLRTSGTY
jgi:hypothetical protein